MKAIKYVITALLMASAMQASAGKLAGKNIILVQGFQFQHVFISRTHDDSVVPLHSACGSSSAGSYNSCVSNRTLDGKVTWFADAPKYLYPYHFPFIQSESLRHNGHQWDDRGNSMAPLITSRNIAGDVDVSVSTKTSWDIFLNKYIRIRDAEQKTMAQVLTATIK